MSTKINVASDLYRLSAGFSVRIEFRDQRLDAVWHPRQPSRSEIEHLVPDYRRARQAFMEEVAKRLGGIVIVVEVE